MKRRRALAALLAGLGALTLAGCASGPTAGTVTSLSHRSGYTWLMPIQHCSGGKYPSCWTQYVPMTEPECWRVNIDDAQHHHGAWCIGEERWHTIHVGDYFKIREGDHGA